jgi:serine/threonine protein kinase
MSIKLDEEDVLRNGQYTVQRHMRSAPDREVYLAYDSVFNCAVALDVFSNKTRMPSGLPVSAWEAQVLRKLGDHRNIARVYDYWVEGGAPMMATRYLPGERLEDSITSSLQVGQVLPIQRILQLSVELADGLAHIHRCGLLYRDMQPHNVLFDDWGTPRLVDFDTAVSIGEHDVLDIPQQAVINYMAPELIYGDDADERADLYSLGATLYEMCEGHPPFVGTREQVLAAVPAEPPPLLRNDVPAGLRDLIVSLLAPDRDQRPASAIEVKARLTSLRMARDNLDRLLASNVGTTLKPALEAYINADGSALTESPSAVSLPRDHGYMKQAIIALAETDYRRAVIDAATATEVALGRAISDHLRQRGWTAPDIRETIRDANGLDGLFARYTKLGSRPKLPVSPDDVRFDLATLRNKAAHKGQIPSAKEAIRAVEIAYHLVDAAHPLNSFRPLTRPERQRRTHEDAGTSPAASPQPTAFGESLRQLPDPSWV